MKEIIILVGIPCSGKSFWTYETGYISVSRDFIREINFITPYIYSKQNEEIVSRICKSRLDTHLKLGSGPIIIDNTHCKEKYIDEIIKNYSQYPIKIKFFKVSLLKAHYRNIIRYFRTNKWIPVKVINQMYKNYNKINKSKYAKFTRDLPM